MRVNLKLRESTLKRLEQLDVPLILGEYLLDPYPLIDRKRRNAMGWTWLDLDLINQIRVVCPKLPFTEAIALILESRVAGGEEAHCRANLRRMLGGEIEVPAGKAGKVDLLTPCGKLIEVKKCQRFSHALGQVLAYHYYFPNYEPYIALFGKKFSNRRMATEVSEKYGVKLIWIDTRDDSISFL